MDALKKFVPALSDLPDLLATYSTLEQSITGISAANYEQHGDTIVLHLQEIRDLFITYDQAARGAIIRTTLEASDARRRDAFRRFRLLEQQHSQLALTASAGTCMVSNNYALYANAEPSEPPVPAPLAPQAVADAAPPAPQRRVR